MSFSEFVAGSREQHRLLTVIAELTYRCNLDCFFCYNDRALKGSPLRPEQYARFFDDLAGLGTVFLTLTGGEPLVHPDFFAIGRAARERGFTIRVKTNGHALRRPLALRLKKEVDPYGLDISLHGAVPETHDRQTRIPGSFRRLMANLPVLKEVGLRVTLRSTLTQWNAGEIAAMFDLADAIGYPLEISTLVSPRDDGDRTPLSVSASADQRRHAMAVINRRVRAAAAAGGGEGAVTTAPKTIVTRHCGAGTNSVTIDPVGNVLPCVEWRRPVGNLHAESIIDIWNRATGLAAVRDLNGQAKSMLDRAGREFRFASFCPGFAERTTGNALNLYPQAVEQAQVVSSLRASES
jgi:radical SAM protein with 4Fe4S-binding SPASM domain